MRLDVTRCGFYGSTLGIRALDWAGCGVVRVRHIVRLVSKGLACPVSIFLVSSAYFSYRVLCTIIPCNSSFSIHIHPLAVNTVEATVSVPTFIQRDVELTPAAVTHLPLAQEMAARWSARRCRSQIADRNTAAPRKLDPGNVGNIDCLAVAVFEHDDKLT
jgi:hypothetical protein